MGRLVEGLIQRRNLMVPYRLHRIMASWREIVGEMAARRSFPTALRRGELHVAVSDATWMQEMTYLKRALLERIRSLVGADAVSSLRFFHRSGAGVQEPAGSCSQPPPEPEDPEELLRREPLAPELAAAMDELEERLGKVVDSDLRRSIRRAFIRDLLKRR